jgi:hypothetical protein
MAPDECACLTAAVFDPHGSDGGRFAFLEVSMGPVDQCACACHVIIACLLLVVIGAALVLIVLGLLGVVK